MFTTSEIETIKTRLENGETPEEVAASLSLAHSSFRSKLSRSGYQIEIRRSLAPVVPVGMEVRELAEATR